MNESLPTAVRILVNLPWAIKSRIARSKLGWRLFAGICRRLGWNERRLGWHTAVNGPYANIHLEAAHANQLWVPMGTYEPSVSRWLVRLLNESHWGCVGKPVWDLGANVGLISLLCAQHGKGRVVSFEPAARNLERFRRHLRANAELAARIELIGVAVSDTDGEIEMCVGDAGSEGHIVHVDVPPGKHDGGNLTKTAVRTLRLDSVLGQDHVVPPGVLKIDVEGAEALVLAGATRLLNEYHPVIVLEVHNEEAGLASISRLTSAGYRVCLISGDQLRELPGASIPYGHLLAFAPSIPWPPLEDSRPQPD